MKYTGQIRKMKTQLSDEVLYELPIGEDLVNMNELIGQEITLSYENKIECIVEPSNVDEDSVKKSLSNEKASPEIISKNLAELKANKVSLKRAD